MENNTFHATITSLSAKAYLSLYIYENEKKIKLDISDTISEIYGKSALNVSQFKKLLYLLPSDVMLMFNGTDYQIINEASIFSSALSRL